MDLPDDILDRILTQATHEWQDHSFVRVCSIVNSSFFASMSRASNRGLQVFFICDISLVIVGCVVDCYNQHMMTSLHSSPGNNFGSVCWFANRNSYSPALFRLLLQQLDMLP
jgi:hypothetical protein